MLRLDAQVQFQFAVDPVDALVVPVERLHVAQVQEAQSGAQLRCLVVRRTSQWAMTSFAAFSLAS